MTKYFSRSKYKYSKWAYLLVFIFYCLINLLWFYNALFHRGSIIGICPSSGCDAIQFLWGQKWVAYSFINHINPLYSNWINWPKGVNGMWQTWALGTAIFSFPLEEILHPITTYNISIFFASVLNCFSFFFLILKFTNKLYLSCFLGLWWGLSPYFAQQFEGHANLATAWSLPLVFYILYQVLFGDVTKWFSKAILLGLLVSYQYLNGVELLVSMAIFAVLSVFLYAVFFFKYLTRKRITLLLKLSSVSSLTFIILCFYPLYVQLYGKLRLIPPLHLVRGVDSGALFVPGRYTLLGHLGFTFLRFAFNKVELGSSVGGFFVIALIITLFFFKRNRLVTYFVVLSFISLVLSAGPKLILFKKSLIILPWDFIGKYEPFKSMLPSRLTLYVLFFGLLAVGISLSTINNISGAFKKGLYLAPLTLAVVGMIPVFPYFSFQLPQPTFFYNNVFNLVKPGEVIFIIPYARDGKSNIAPMLWQADSNMRFKMMGGYALVPDKNGKLEPVGGWPPTGLILATEQILTGGHPPVVGDPVNPILASHSYLRFLKDNGIALVVVGPSKNEKLEVKYLVNVFRKKPTWSQGVFYWKISG